MTKCQAVRGFQVIGVLAVLAAAGACSGPQGIPASSALGPPSAQSAGRPTIHEFNDLLGESRSVNYSPSAIAAGAKHELWVADNIDQDAGESGVVHLSPSGAQLNVFYYGGVTSEGSYFADITPGPDGALWLTDSFNEQIVRMTTGGAFTGYPLGTLYSSNYLQGIAAGPDGALWFADFQSGKPAVGHITTSGTITFFTSGITPSAFLKDIVAGPDGAMWFTEFNTDAIGRITMSGKVTEYSKGITGGAEPWSIAAGPDGALWFTEQAGRIGRITTKGRVTEYSQGITPTEEPFGIAAGPDGALWFTEFETYNSYRSETAKIGRITTAGSIHEYSGFNRYSEPTDIVAGSHKQMWFVETAVDKLGRVRL